MVRMTLIAATLALTGCASTTTQFAGYGGVETKTDPFSGFTFTETGKGFIYCPASESTFCNPGFSMSFRTFTYRPNVIVAKVSYRDYENLTNLALNIDDDYVTLKPVDQRTELTRVDGLREASRRYELPIELVNRMLAAQKVLVRVEMLNNKVSGTGDFNRPVTGGASAKDLLVALLAKSG